MQKIYSDTAAIKILHSGCMGDGSKETILNIFFSPMKEPLKYFTALLDLLVSTAKLGQQPTHAQLQRKTMSPRQIQQNPHPWSYTLIFSYKMILHCTGCTHKSYSAIHVEEECT